MKFFFHLAIFFSLFLPMAFATQWIGHTFSLHLDLYGLWILAAICGLTRWEGIASMILLGWWLDALQPNIYLFGFTSLLLSMVVWVCQKQSWRIIFEAHLRIAVVFFQTFLQVLYLIGIFFIEKVPFAYLGSYFSSWFFSAVLSALLTPPLLKFQKRYLL